MKPITITEFGYAGCRLRLREPLTLTPEIDGNWRVFKYDPVGLRVVVHDKEGEEQAATEIMEEIGWLWMDMVKAPICTPEKPWDEEEQWRVNALTALIEEVDVHTA